MRYNLASADVAARITEVLIAISTSEEWGRQANSVASMDWLESREPFRRFFDVFEGRQGEEWRADISFFGRGVYSPVQCAIILHQLTSPPASPRC